MAGSLFPMDSVNRPDAFMIACALTFAFSMVSGVFAPFNVFIEFLLLCNDGLGESKA